jgi:mitochondrial fission protein ELM1
MRVRRTETITGVHGKQIAMSETATARARTCWVVTDGRAGIEAQALGLAEAIALLTPLSISRKRIKMRAPWGMLPRALPGDAFAKLDAGSDALAAPFPDLWIGCGRLSVPLTLQVKQMNAATFTVQVQDPRAPSALFDLVIPPQHDGLAGDNVFPIIGAPIRLPANPSVVREGNGSQHVVVLIGGPNRAFKLTRDDADTIAAKLKALADDGAMLAVTTSRRTPPDVAERFFDRLHDVAGVFWRAGVDDDARNPYPAMLAKADAILVTEDSVNMATEAAATGKPVHILSLRRKPFASAAKFDAFHDALRRHGAARLFTGGLEKWTYPPLDETARAAAEIIRRWL